MRCTGVLSLPEILSKAPFCPVSADPGAGCKSYNIMNIRENLPVLAILAGLVAVVVVSSLILGGYGAILAAVGFAVAIAPEPTDPGRDA